MAKKATSTPGSASKAKAAPATKAAPAKAPVAVPAPAPAKSVAKKPVVTSEMISKRAYEIWVAKGRPIGLDLENWQQAERELGVK